VVLPQPDGPSSVKNSPSRTPSETSSTARTPEKLRATPSMPIAVRSFSLQTVILRRSRLLARASKDDGPYHAACARVEPPRPIILRGSLRSHLRMTGLDRNELRMPYLVLRMISWIFFIVSARLASQASSS